jgi:hypothetical protein
MARNANQKIHALPAEVHKAPRFRNRETAFAEMDAPGAL